MMPKSRMNIREARFVREIAALADGMYRLGWDERNGGNISMLLEEEEALAYSADASALRTLPLQFDGGALAGRHLIVTGSGKYFKNVQGAPEINLGILRVAADGASVDILWGLADGAVPTSELPSHFLSHAARLEADPAHRIVIHCHATHLIAMSFTHALNEREFTRTIWQMCTECLVVLPDGIGILPWLVPGTKEIGLMTAEKMRNRRLVLWPFHGIYGTGASADEAFGLIETAEKAAQVYTCVQAQGGVRQAITDEQLGELALAFGVEPREGYLAP
jgi:rhamnulose-1-phosphate aldolase